MRRRRGAGRGCSWRAGNLRRQGPETPSGTNPRGSRANPSRAIRGTGSGEEFGLMNRGRECAVIFRRYTLAPVSSLSRSLLIRAQAGRSGWWPNLLPDRPETAPRSPPTSCQFGPALRAHHARTERRHGQITRQVVDVDDHPMPALAALDVERPHAVRAHVRQVHGLDGFVGTGHNRGSGFRLDLVPRQLERFHNCLCLSDRNESVNALPALTDVVRESAGDHSSNRCLLRTNRHEDPHNGCNPAAAWAVPPRLPFRKLPRCRGIVTQ
jgi:hypothetical protein